MRSVVIRRLFALRADRGATAVEYALMVAFIALAIFGGVTAFGQFVLSLFQMIPPHL